MIIPKGTTGKTIRCLRFRIWKNFAKRFSDVLLLESNINLHMNEII